MTPEWLTPMVRKWMKRTDATPPDATQSARQVMSRLPQVRQRSRWWPLPAFRRGATPRTANQTDYQPTSIPATNGHSPTVTGSTQSMFSPVKAITAGAVVFALGGLFLVAQPFDQQGDGIPGAEGETDVNVLVEITGTTGGPETCDLAALKVALAGDHYTNRGYACTESDWAMSDPRLNGTVTTMVTSDRYGQLTEDGAQIGSVAVSISNEDGTWRGRPEPQVTLPWGTVATNNITILDGEGAYEGMVAVLEIPDGPGGERGYLIGGGDIRGYILENGFPPAPENASTR